MFVKGPPRAIKQAGWFPPGVSISKMLRHEGVKRKKFVKERRCIKEMWEASSFRVVASAIIVGRIREELFGSVFSAPLAESHCENTARRCPEAIRLPCAEYQAPSSLTQSFGLKGGPGESGTLRKSSTS